MSSSREEFSVRFRTRNANGLLLLASDSTTTIMSSYTVLEVGPFATFKQYDNNVESGIVEYFARFFFALLSANHSDVFAQPALRVFPRFAVYT